MFILEVSPWVLSQFSNWEQSNFKTWYVPNNHLSLKTVLDKYFYFKIETFYFSKFSR